MWESLPCCVFLNLLTCQVLFQLQKLQKKTQKYLAALVLFWKSFGSCSQSIFNSTALQRLSTFWFNSFLEVLASNWWTCQCNQEMHVARTSPFECCELVVFGRRETGQLKDTGSEAKNTCKRKHGKKWEWCVWTHLSMKIPVWELTYPFLKNTLGDDFPFSFFSTVNSFIFCFHLSMFPFSKLLQKSPTSLHVSDFGGHWFGDHGGWWTRWNQETDHEGSWQHLVAALAKIDETKRSRIHSVHI